MEDRTEEDIREYFEKKLDGYFKALHRDEQYQFAMLEGCEVGYRHGFKVQQEKIEELSESIFKMAEKYNDLADKYIAIKEQLSEKNKQIEKLKDSLRHCADVEWHDKEGLLKQIEAMKCCGNCWHEDKDNCVYSYTCPNDKSASDSSWKLERFD